MVQTGCVNSHKVAPTELRWLAQRVAYHHVQPPSMHWEFISKLESLPELSIPLGQAVQGTQPVEAANDKEAAGEAMAEKQQARKQQGPCAGLMVESKP